MAFSKLILFVQFIAAIFMATDYFLDEKRRGLINTKLQSLVKPIHNSIETDIRSYWVTLEDQWIKVGFSLVIIVLAVLSIILNTYLKGILSPGNLFSLYLFITIALVFTLPFLLSLLINIVLPATLAGFFLSFTWFLIRCPKGTIFGVGFLFLLVSFGLRYVALSSV